LIKGRVTVSTEIGPIEYYQFFHAGTKKMVMEAMPNIYFGSKVILVGVCTFRTWPNF